MAEFVLSRTEIAQLCRTPLKVRQCAFLRDNGIKHYVDGHGWPVVLRSSVEGGDTAPNSATAWKPNKAA